MLVETPAVMLGARISQRLAFIILRVRECRRQYEIALCSGAVGRGTGDDELDMRCVDPDLTNQFGIGFPVQGVFGKYNPMHRAAVTLGFPDQRQGEVGDGAGIRWQPGLTDTEPAPAVSGRVLILYVRPEIRGSDLIGIRNRQDIQSFAIGLRFPDGMEPVHVDAATWR